VALKRLRLAQRRKALGLTQEALADRLGCERTTVIRWERGETEPQPWLRPKLCQVLQVTADELHVLLGDVAEIPDHREGFTLVSSVPLDFSLSAAHTIHVMEGFSAHDIASRREALAELAVLTSAALLQPVRQWAAVLAAPPSTAEPVGTDEVTELEQAVTLFRRWDASGAGGLRRKAVVGQLNAVAESLNEHHSPAITKRLFQVTAELAQLAGWMAYDQGLFGTAQRYYLLALHACRESACPELGSKIIGDMTQLSTALGNYDDSLSLVHTALYSLPRQASALVRSELLGLEARAYAQLGSSEAGHAARSAEACVAVYEEAPTEPLPDWLHYMNLAEVDCLAANAYTEVALHSDDQRQWRNVAARAEVHALRARHSRGEGYVRSRIFDEIRLAKVRLAQRDPAEAVSVGSYALQLAGDTRSSLVVDWFIRFDHSLTERYQNEAETAAFHEELREYLRQAAPLRLSELS
jgi:transcriptional regulator with XRE-family HTH domain